MLNRRDELPIQSRRIANGINPIVQAADNSNDASNVLK